jgi:hypothetical protein
MAVAVRASPNSVRQLAEHERLMISTRVKEALAAAMARGVVLGNPNLAAARRRAAEVRRARKPAPELVASSPAWPRKASGNAKSRVVSTPWNQLIELDAYEARTTLVRD